MSSLSSRYGRQSMIGMSMSPWKYSPFSYAAFIAAIEPVRRGAGVAPPSVLRRSLRALHGSNVPPGSERRALLDHLARVLPASRPSR